MPTATELDQALDDVDRQTAVGILSRDLMRFYDAADMDSFSDMAYQAWTRHADVLLDAMYMWFRFTIHIKGEQYVRWAVNRITCDVWTLDADEPGSRMVFCDVIYAMLDESNTKATAAWQPVREREDWPVACEVIALMLAYMGHFVGEPRGVTTEDTT